MKSAEEIREAPYLMVRQIGSDGGSGEIMFGKLTGSVIWSNGGGWDHVSIAPYKRHYTPTWDDMCRLKDMFFREDEVVVQYHPAKTEYVNNVANCLHLWRPQVEALPVPPSFMVGLKKGQTVSDMQREYEKYMRALEGGPGA